jgi:hypothetical protein
MTPFDDNNKNTIVHGESNFHQNVVDSNLPGIILTGQDTFNLCNNCIFQRNNNLKSTKLYVYFDISFSSRQIWKKFSDSIRKFLQGYYKWKMILVEAGHAHVMKFLLLSCGLLIFVAVNVIRWEFYLLFFKLTIESKNIELFCTQFNSCVYSFFHIILMFFIWSGNHKFYI